MKRVYHTWEKWECYPAGFYEDRAPESFNGSDCRQLYANFLKDSERFGAALRRIINDWPNSCEHYLSNENMNRIAWLGQAAACIDLGLPACYRSGYHLLTETEQAGADALALRYLNVWLEKRGELMISPDEAQSKTIPNLY